MLENERGVELIYESEDRKGVLYEMDDQLGTPKQMLVWSSGNKNERINIGNLRRKFAHEKPACHRWGRLHRL
jgi:hypothetical protein